MSYKPPSVWYVCKYCKRSYRVRTDLIRHKHEHIQFREQKHRQRLEKLIRSSENHTSCTNNNINNNTHTTQKSTEQERIETSNNKLNTTDSRLSPGQEDQVFNSSRLKKDQMRELAKPPIQVQVQVQPVKPVNSGEDFPRTVPKEKEQVQPVPSSDEGTAETTLLQEDCEIETEEREDGEEKDGLVEDGSVSVSKSSMKNCDRCNKSFSSEYYLKYHELLDHSGDSSLNSSSSSSLQSPNPSSTNNLDQLIEPDSTNFNSLKRNNPRPNNPQHDAKKTKTKKSKMNKNKINKSKSNSTRCSCSICPKSFKNAGHLKSHMKSHERTEKTLFFCNFCSKSLELKDEAFFHRHVDICSKLSEFPCSVSNCPLTFHFKADLQTHELVDHGIMAELHCTVCSRLGKFTSFTRQSALTSHLRIQHCCTDQVVES